MRYIANFIPQFIKSISITRFIVAIALAVIVWGYVIVSQYPEQTLPAQEILLGDPIPPPDGLQVVPSDNQVTSVRITLSGPTTAVQSVAVSQIKPYLDLSSCRAGTCFPKVQLKQALPNYVTWKSDPETVQVSLETVANKTMTVEIVRGTDVSPDYTLEGDLVPSPTEVKVTGRQSLIDRVAKAQVSVNLNGRVGGFRLTQNVNLLDTRNQPVTDAGLVISPATINVSGNIVSRLASRTVPIRVITTGEPADGYIAGTAQANPLLATVVSGNLDTLNNLEYISTQPVDISGATTEVSTTVKLQAIPDVTITGGDTVQVAIGIVPFQTSKTISVRVELVNSAANLRYSFEPTDISLTLSGPYTAFQPDLPLDKIRATVNVQDRGVGTYTVPVQVELPENLVVTNNPTVKVTILPPVTPTPQPTSTPVPTPTRTIAPTSTPTQAPSASPTVSGTVGISQTTPPVTTAPPATPSPGSTTVAQRVNEPTNPVATSAPSTTPVPTVAAVPEKIITTTTGQADPTTPTPAPPQPTTPPPSLQVISREAQPTPTRSNAVLLLFTRPAKPENSHQTSLSPSNRYL